MAQKIITNFSSLNSEEIKKLEPSLIGQRVKIVLMKEPTLALDIKLKADSKKIISSNCIEFTYHPYDENNNQIGDDNFGYDVENIFSLEIVRPSTKEEAGALIW